MKKILLTALMSCICFNVNANDSYLPPGCYTKHEVWNELQEANRLLRQESLNPNTQVVRMIREYRDSKQDEWDILNTVCNYRQPRVPENVTYIWIFN